MTDCHRFDPTLLREYDVRGIVGKTLSDADAKALGRAFGTIVRRSGGARVCVGYDGRLSSPEMESAVVSGLMEAGINVTRVGRGPTPMLYYAVCQFEADGGIMITGSHNPPDYNGFKMMLGRKSFYGTDIQDLGALAAAGDFESGEGSAEKVEILTAYVDVLVKAYEGDRPLKVAWDSGNGAAGEVMSRLTERLEGTHILINAEIDGTFPNHHPDPTVIENLRQLQDSVAAQGCDLGIAFDGDGDRIGVIDGKGHVLWGDQLMMIWAAEILNTMPGATIIADVKASQALFDEIERLGGKPLMWKTGHSPIKSKMLETGAPLAGEMSGHIFFADRYFGFDDALYAAVRLLSIISRSGESLADIHARMPALMNTPELRFDCPEDRKFVVIDEVKARLETAGAQINDIDGVRVKTGDGWWLLRASNTQAVLVARCESSTMEGLERLKAALVGQLKESSITPPDF
ncbi:MAG: phosphomannomutase/phosphoglucomutase [Rhodospirillaceae bacterium]|jgi:phosphomannomutase|nr:phosphomannomutase/phosphoglucomutase [Rhodospirillaceae bacterium]